MPTHTESLKDHFLIATPALSGGFFAKSLTYICEHNALGAMGIVVNQPLDIPLTEIFEQLELEVSEVAVLFELLSAGTGSVAC